MLVRSENTCLRELFLHGQNESSVPAPEIEHRSLRVSLLAESTHVPPCRQLFQIGHQLRVIWLKVVRFPRFIQEVRCFFRRNRICKAEAAGLTLPNSKNLVSKTSATVSFAELFLSGLTTERTKLVRSEHQRFFSHFAGVIHYLRQSRRRFTRLRLADPPSMSEENYASDLALFVAELVFH